MDSESQLMSLEDLAHTHHFPISFVRLAVDCGCPLRNGMIDSGSFVLWLLHNYALVRAKAGLPELPGEEGLTERAAAHIKIGNMFLTIADYLRSRSTHEDIKVDAAEMSKSILRIMG